jgi:hypothetical protein
MPAISIVRTLAISVALQLGTTGRGFAQTLATPALPGVVPQIPATSPGLPLGTSPTAVSAPHVFAPTMPRTTYSRYPWKTDIVATVFWIGEEPTQNNPTPNDKSSWDTAWKQSYGGYDDPDPADRTTAYTPKAFTPKQNPFYIALPYNDVLDSDSTKAEAKAMIPWFAKRFVKRGRTVLKGQWLAIRYGNRVCYAQWEDCGPFVTDDIAYVFGNARPKNTNNNGAGLDISPSVRDYLGMKSGAKCDWRFVDVNEIPAGPWRTYGTNNPFIQASNKEKSVLGTRLEELRRMRDEYFRTNGNTDQRAR